MTKLDIPIITYHSIDDSGSVISTSPVVFQRQMAQLSKMGYTAISLSKLVTLLKSDGTIPAKVVVLTFDDGFRNFRSTAFPIMSELNFSGTVFLVTDYCGKCNDWEGNPSNLPRGELLSWVEIRELDGLGIEFGSHSRTHADLTRISQEKLQDEVHVSKMCIEDALGRPSTTFAYPYGRSNQSVRAKVSEYFDAGCTTTLGKVSNTNELFSLCRLDAFYLSNERLFGMLQSKTFNRYMHLRQSMRTVRSLLRG